MVSLNGLKTYIEYFSNKINVTLLTLKVNFMLNINSLISIREHLNDTHLAQGNAEF